MRNDTKLNLVDISWPISILKFNQRVDRMRPGEQLTVTLKDVEAKDKMVLLIRAKSDLEFDLRDLKGCYCLNIKKRSVS